MEDVWIVIGSKSDEKRISELTQRLEEQRISYRVSVFSAHRNLYELIKYVKGMKMVPEEYPKVIIAAAGMSAALPGVLASLLKAEMMPIPLIGLPLGSSDYPDGADARISIDRLPPGVRELVSLVSDTNNAAWGAIMMINHHSDEVEKIKDLMLSSKKRDSIPTLGRYGGEKDA